MVQRHTDSLNNSADKPGPVKKAVTPQHRKTMNRPRRRLVQVDKKILILLAHFKFSFQQPQYMAGMFVLLTKSVSFLRCFSTTQGCVFVTNVTVNPIA